MKLLILGGTKFLGPHLVAAAAVRGHAVTLFNRGLCAEAPAGVEFVQGDRNSDIGLLAGRRWDALIDTCGFVPRAVRATVSVLGGAVERYLFVSSISVYAEPLREPFDESQPVIELADPSTEAVTDQTYGGLKALCERELRAAVPDKALMVRPGLIVGPLDPTDRFTYWPHRFALGGDVLVPGTPDTDVALIDVRDLAQWMVCALEEGATGTFNAAGTYGALRMGDVVSACMAASGVPARPVWVEEAFVLAHGVAPWTELPLWVPAGEDSFGRTSSARAIAAGLSFRPLADTVRATLEWTTSRGLGRPLRAGLSREREAELLAAWSRQLAAS